MASKQIDIRLTIDADVDALIFLRTLVRENDLVAEGMLLTHDGWGHIYIYGDLTTRITKAEMRGVRM